jgi:alpha-galactosidase
MAANRTVASNEYQADPTKFPSGMKEIGVHIHQNGFLYGIYTSAGTKTCQGLPGSLGSEDRDAQTFADWGVDFLKYDNCYNENIPSIDRYPKMRDALNKTGRPIFYSLCQWVRILVLARLICKHQTCRSIRRLLFAKNKSLRCRRLVEMGTGGW